MLDAGSLQQNHSDGSFIVLIHLQLGFVVPLAARPQQCHDAITPNDMYSDLTCAFSGAFLLFGGFAAIVWGRSLNLPKGWLHETDRPRISSIIVHPSSNLLASRAR